MRTSIKIDELRSKFNRDIIFGDLLSVGILEYTLNFKKNSEGVFEEMSPSFCRYFNLSKDGSLCKRNTTNNDFGPVYDTLGGGDKFKISYVVDNHNVIKCEAYISEFDSKEKKFSVDLERNHTKYEVTDSNSVRKTTYDYCLVSDNFKVKFPEDADEYHLLFNIIFVGSICAPILRIFGSFSPFNFNNDDKLIAWYDIDKNIIEENGAVRLYSSIHDSSMTHNNRTETIINTTNDDYYGSVTTPSSKVKYIMDHYSMIANEIITYDSYGDIKDYSNAFTGISMHTIKSDKTVTKLIYYHNSLIDIYYEDISDNGKIEYLASSYLKHTKFNHYDYTVEKRVISGKNLNLDIACKIYPKVYDLSGRFIRLNTNGKDSSTFINIPRDLENKFIYDKEKIKELAGSDFYTNLAKSSEDDNIFSQMLRIGENITILETPISHMWIEGERDIESKLKYMHSTNQMYIENKSLLENNSLHFLKNIKSNKLITVLKCGSKIVYSMAEIYLDDGSINIEYTDDDVRFRLVNNELKDYHSELYNAKDGIYIRNKYGIPTKLDNIIY